MELRAQKPLEKIKVKELCDLACINKSTFYAHYQDIYALANAMEDEMVQAMRATAEIAVPMPNIPEMDVMWTVVSDLLTDVVMVTRFTHLKFLVSSLVVITSYLLQSLHSLLRCQSLCSYLI